MNHWDGNADADAAKALLTEAKATSDPEAKAEIVAELANEVAEQVLVLVPMTVPVSFEVWDPSSLAGYESDPYSSRYRLTESWVTE